MAGQFISETIKPLCDTCDTLRMAAGEPGLPCKFLWRGRTIEIATILSAWRETGRCRHGSPERYIRKHWFEVLTTCGETMKIYFDRQPRGGRKSERWWLFSLEVKPDQPGSLS